MTYRSEEAPVLGPNKKHCFACANILDARAELCPRCGVRQPSVPGMNAPVLASAPVVISPPAPTTTRSKTTAALLAFFLGGIGVHKFYLGQGGLGVVYLLFCWTFIPAIVAFIEFLVLLGMSERDFATRYPG